MGPDPSDSFDQQRGGQGGRAWPPGQFGPGMTKASLASGGASALTAGRNRLMIKEVPPRTAGGER